MINMIVTIILLIFTILAGIATVKDLIKK